MRAEPIHRDLIADAPVTRLGGRTPTARWFFGALALLTLVPLAGMPLAFGPMHVRVTSLPAGLLLTVLAITGSMHVGSTAFFYVDRDFRPLIRVDRRRFLWALALVPIGLFLLGISGAAFIGSWMFFALFAFQTTWLFYHYQRQNFGLISLVSTNAGSGPLPAHVGPLLNVVALAGVVATLGLPGLYPAGLHRLMPVDLQATFRSCGIVLYLLSIPLLVSVFWRHASLRRDPWLAVGLVLGWAFFLPAVVGNPFGFLPLAVAHGAQYVFMMMILSARSSRRWLGLVAMCALGAGIGYVLDSVKQLPAILLAVGVVQVHFLLDAKVWRLREPQQRAIMNRRFDFLLAR